MRDFIVAHQLNMMLVMGSICGMIALFSYISKAVTRRRKVAMIGMEISAMVLLFSDICAYIYRGQLSEFAMIMTRVSNFLVYSMIIGVEFFVNMFIEDLCVNEGGDDKVPGILLLNDRLVLIAELLIIFSQFTGLYYIFDETNHYVRSDGFIIGYIFPVIIPVLFVCVLMKYRGRLSRRIVIPLVLFLVAPLIASVVQIFCYGISLTDMTIVGVIIIIYVFTLIDTNEKIAEAHELELDILRKENMSKKRLFDETSKVFVSAIERKYAFMQGQSSRIADTARKLAEKQGKSDEECDKVYYSALLHDIGMIFLPEGIVRKEKELTDKEYKLVKKTPVFSSEILSGIKEYPYLSESVRYCYERYDGTGYPEGLSGKYIPEISRIVAVAGAYDAMMSKRRYRDSLSAQVVREELLKGAGTQFDPEYSKLMVQLMDSEKAEDFSETETKLDKELRCRNYRDRISVGIPVSNTESILRFRCKNEGAFSSPAVILFDSFDGKVHDNAKAIDSNHYKEYGEVWFDGHSILTDARDLKIIESPEEDRNMILTGEITEDWEKSEVYYEMIFGRYEDHLMLSIIRPDKTIKAVMALPNKSMRAYISLTGENCIIYDLEVEHLSREYGIGDIPRIADEISYIDRIEADIPNVQVDRTRSASTDGIEVRNGQEIRFHSMSLPTAPLVWECPYIVLFYSEDGKVYGEGYREYALIKLNGEIESSGEYAENHFYTEKSTGFAGWNQWKDSNRKGLDYVVNFTEKGSRVEMDSDNLGILIQNITDIKEPGKRVYAAITGDKVALTDIRIL
ncbi:MAG: HD domain-containing protein [Oribacterium sp.]|nr:HD domain-containing protein [Oribacterium sp.]